MRQDKQHREDSPNGKTTAVIPRHLDVSGFLLLDDPANELLLPAGLGADRVLPIRDVAYASRVAKRCA